MRLNLFGILVSGALACALPSIAATPQITQPKVVPESELQQIAPAGSKVVILAVIVETDGSVSNATVQKSSGLVSADFAAIDHARHLKISPQVQNGVPVRAQKKIAIAVKSKNASAEMPPAPPIPPYAPTLPRQQQELPSIPVMQPTIKAIPELKI